MGRSQSLVYAAVLAVAMAVPSQLAEPVPEFLSTPSRAADTYSVRYTRAIAASRARRADAPAHGFVVHLDAEGRPFVPEPGMEGLSSERDGGRGTAEQPLEVVDAPGGGKMVVLDPRFDLYSTARLRPDGRTAASCGRALPVELPGGGNPAITSASSGR